MQSLGGIIGHVIVLSVVDLRSDKNKKLAWIQNNLSELSDMSVHGLLYQ